MTRNLLLLVGLPVLLWVLVSVPARRLSGSDDVLWYSGTAALLCIVPMTVAFVVKSRLAQRDPRLATLLTLGATGIRMFVVLIGGVLLTSLVPFFRGQAFWLWLGGFYFATLTLDVALSVREQPSDPAKPSAHGPV